MIFQVKARRFKEMQVLRSYLFPWLGLRLQTANREANSNNTLVNNHRFTEYTSVSVQRAQCNFFFYFLWTGRSTQVVLAISFTAWQYDFRLDVGSSVVSWKAWDKIQTAWKQNGKRVWIRFSYFFLLPPRCLVFACSSMEAEQPTTFPCL